MLSVLRPRKHARHAKPSRVAPILVAGGMAAAFAVTDSAVLTSSASAGGSLAQFERLAQCESGGNWAINTRNGYYGGLQFNLSTWRGLGYGGYPHQASKATQVSAGQKLHGQRGWSPWPACSRKLGLSGDGGVSSTGGSTSTSGDRRDAASTASRNRPTSAAPAFDGRPLTVADIRTYRASVRTWQARMKARGWRITVDGYYGPQSASVATRFAAEKRLSAARGTVNAAVWKAAWTAPVS